MNLFWRISSRAPAILIRVHDLLLVKIICVQWRWVVVITLRSRKVKTLSFRFPMSEIWVHHHLLLLVTVILVTTVIIIGRICWIIVRIPGTIHLCYVSKWLPLFVPWPSFTDLIGSLWRLYLVLLLFFGQRVSLIPDCSTDTLGAALFGIMKTPAVGRRLIISRMRLHV